MASATQENAFLAGFPSLPGASDGRAHILEHLALSGSQRFPVRAPFFSMLRRSLATHMNARTEADRAAYFFASTHQLDFFNLLDVYLDACFFPTLDRLDFMQEGWRHVLEDGDLAFQGVVLNEMKGAMADPMHTLRREIIAQLFSGTPYEADPGGDPLLIPGLSHAMLRSFHAQHYRPAQAVFMSAGAMAPSAIQERIGTRVLGDSRDQAARPLPPLPALPAAWDAPRCQQVRVPSLQAQPALHGVQMAWLLEETSDAFARCCAGLLSAGLLNAGAPLRLALESARFGRPARLQGVDTDMRLMVFHVGMDGLHGAQVDQAQHLILSTLEQVARDGVPVADLQAALRDMRYRQRDTDGGGHTPFALRRLLQALPLALYGGDVLAGFDNEAVLRKLDARIRDPRFFKDLVRALLDNPTRLATHVVPDSGFFATRAAAEQRILAAHQAGLSDGARARIEQDSAALAARQAQPDDNALLPRIRPCDIGPSPRALPGGVRQPDGATVFRAATNGIVHAGVLYDVTRLAPDDWPWLDLYVRVLPGLGVGALDSADAVAWRRAAAPAFGIAVDAAPTPDGGMYLDVAFSAAGLEGDEASVAELLSASVAGVRFDETTRLAYLVERLVQERFDGLAGAGRHYALLAAAAPLSAAHRFRNAVEGAPALAFRAALRRLCRSEDGVAQLAARLAALHAQVTATVPATLCVGAETATATLARLLSAPTAFGAAAPLSTRPAPPSPAGAPANLALLAGGQVNHCTIAWRAPPIGHPDAGALAVAAELLAAALHRSLREGGGAYGAYAQYDGDAGLFAMGSVHDPRLAATYADFDAAVDAVGRRAIAADAFDDAIVGAIRNLDRPLPPYRDALHAWRMARAGITAAAREALRAAVLACTPDQVRAAVAAWLAPAGASRAAFVGIPGQDLAGLEPIELRAAMES
ncbi:insulinase family protein [Massilia sp. 9096]|uniref:insulinase family protein n=1 Tax=Massilia sp. 9096 TaxID=1500894 RepID=UPI00068B7159|nr:insulinase family protein [Massilia sp. 9096]